MGLKQTHIMYGFIIGLIMIIVNVILYMTGLAFNRATAWVSYLAYIPFLAGIILNGAAFSKANDGFVTFGNVFASCFKASAIITLILLVWAFISLAIFPDIKDKGIEMARESMMRGQNISDDQMDKALEMTRKYFTTFMVAGVLFGTMIWGALFSLLGAAFAKKKGNSPEVMQ